MLVSAGGSNGLSTRNKGEVVSSGSASAAAPPGRGEIRHRQRRLSEDQLGRCRLQLGLEPRRRLARRKAFPPVRSVSWTAAIVKGGKCRRLGPGVQALDGPGKIRTQDPCGHDGHVSPTASTSGAIYL